MVTVVQSSVAQVCRPGRALLAALSLAVLTPSSVDAAPQAETTTPSRPIAEAVQKAALQPSAGAATTPGGDEAFWAALDQADAHYQGQRYRAALRAYEAALNLAPDGADVGTLQFNTAACLFELGRYTAAEQRFIQSAQDNPDIRVSARLNAGFAALGDQRIVDAKAHLESTPSSSTEPLRRTLSEAIAAAEREIQRKLFLSWLGDGVRDFEKNRPATSLHRLAHAHAFRSSGHNGETQHLALIAAAAAFQLGHYALARAQLARAGAAASSPEAQLLSADIAMQQHADARAELEYLAALDQGLDPEDEQHARDSLSELYGLPASGFGGWASAGGGYDSNARQSAAAGITGVEETTGATTESEQASGSPMFTLGVGLDHSWSSGPRSTITPFYSGYYLGLTSGETSNLSLQSHQIGASLRYALDRANQIRFGVSTTLLMEGAAHEGLGNTSPFNWQSAARATFSQRPSDRWHWQISAEGGPALGFGDFEYLDGGRAALQGEATYTAGPGRVRLRAGARGHFIGTLTAEYSNADFQVIPAGQQATYSVPLSYVAGLASARGEVRWLGRVRLGGTATLESRQYLQASELEGIEGTAKTRQDQRTRLRADCEVELDRSRRLSAIFGYDYLLSLSNVGEDDFDYDDRNFDQHLVELTVQATF